jgi:hypothetical protein
MLQFCGIVFIAMALESISGKMSIPVANILA